MAGSTTTPIPFSEPPWLLGFPSPFYTESHRKWQKTCRAFIGENLVEHAVDWERDGEVPADVFKKFSRSHMLIPNLPAPLPVAALKRLGVHELPGGLPLEEFDYIHFSIYVSEMRRAGVGGPTSSLNAGMAYGVPPIIKYGSQELQDRFLPDLLRGDKRICIAITEPSAGSDVANISTTAVKSECGKYYIVNGTKKW